MTLAVEQAKAEKNLFWLLELELTYRIEGKTWTQAAAPNTSAWYMDHAAEGEPSRVYQLLRSTHAVSSFTERATLALCHANASSWYYDAATGRLYVHMSGSDTPATSGKYYLRSHFWRYYSTHQYQSPNEIVIGGARVEPRLGKVPAQLTQEVNDFSEAGIRETWGIMKLINGDGGLDAALLAYVWHGCPFRLKVGARGDAYANLVAIHRGRTGSWAWTMNEVTLSFEDPMRAED